MMNTDIIECLMNKTDPGTPRGCFRCINHEFRQAANRTVLCASVRNWKEANKVSVAFPLMVILEVRTSLHL